MASSLSLSTFFFFFFFRYTLSASVSYTQHCSSVVPESTTTVPTYHDPLPLQFTSFYFTGGDSFFRPTNQATNQTYSFGGRFVRLRFVQNYYETTAAGVYKVQASFLIRSPYNQYYSHNISNNRARSGSGYGGSYYRKRAARGSVRFSLTGFWSGVSRKLCMVGSASWQVEETRAAVNLAAVLKVNYAAENPDIHTAAVAGSFQSTSSSSANDPGYFDPILLFDFPVSRDYNYSLVPFSTDSEFPKNQSLDLQKVSFCSVLSSRIKSELAYDAVDECRESRRRCSPLAGSSSPRFLSLRSIQCLGGEMKLRFIANFHNQTYGYDQDFSRDSTFVGEASWDETNNHLSGVLCRLLNPIENPSNVVGDCTTRFVLRYPSIWSIRSDAKVNGRLWSTKPVNDSSYFRKIDLKSPDEIDTVALPGMKYDYTESERVRNLCPMAVKKLPNNGSIYPDGHSYDMRFDLSLKNSNGEQIGWGYATPISVGIDLFERSSSMLVAVDAFAPESAPRFADVEEGAAVVAADSSPLNMSYTVSINYFLTSNSTNPQDRMYLTAEGVYNPKTGYLCMVGCRKIHNYSTSVNDCELLVKFEFAPTNEKNRGGFTKGTISSTRPKSDPLYFKELTFSSTSYYGEQVVGTISRMDLEIAMVLISNTLSCVFVALQIFHGRRNPEVQSCISIAMLVVLSLGHMIPLVLNFEALFLGSQNKQTFLMSSGKWLEANEVAIRVVTMVAFLLQIRLLQSVWSAKETEDNKIEKKASFISLAVYVFGGFITLLLNWSRGKRSPPSSYNGDLGISSTLWGDVRSYVGLILDGFLLPQIVLNAIRGGMGRTALSGPFYVGTSAVRLVPHAYDQYRLRSYPTAGINGTYFYADQSADFYSTAWDFVIPCGVVALAVVVFLQQRYGGRCILPRGFGEVELYEKVPVVSNE
ncbi:hypothetical protein ABFS83_08G184000 [Erythranthe nasuta]